MARLERDLVMLNSAGVQSASFALLALSSWADLAFYVALREAVWARPEGRVGTALGCPWAAGPALDR